MENSVIYDLAKLIVGDFPVGYESLEYILIFLASGIVVMLFLSVIFSVFFLAFKMLD